MRVWTIDCVWMCLRVLFFFTKTVPAAVCPMVCLYASVHFFPFYSCMAFAVRAKIKRPTTIHTRWEHTTQNHRTQSREHTHTRSFTWREGIARTREREREQRTAEAAANRILFWYIIYPVFRIAHQFNERFRLNVMCGALNQWELRGTCSNEDVDWASWENQRPRQLTKELNSVKEICLDFFPQKFWKIKKTISFYSGDL